LGLAQAHAKRARDLIPDSALREASGLRNRAEAGSLLGNVAYRCGDPGAALPYYREAAEFLQASGDIRGGAYQLAAAGIAASQLQQAADEPAGAVSELRAAVEREPNDLGLQTQLAIALWRSSGDGQAAVAILNWVLSMDSGHPGARRARGEILADLGDASGAMLDLDHVAAGHPASRAARGLALAELGDHTAAAEEVNGSLADARRSGPVLLYAARASELAGDKVSARFRAQEALDAEDPPLFRAHRQMARELAGQRRGFADSYPRSS
jgi:tetratricopeptide (TPR) repeat protein